VFLATGGHTLKIALFYKKGTFGRKKGTFGRMGVRTPASSRSAHVQVRNCQSLCHGVRSLTSAAWSSGDIVEGRSCCRPIGTLARRRGFVDDAQKLPIAITTICSTSPTVLNCEVFMWRHWCYINASTVWRIAPFWNIIHAPSRPFPKRYCAIPAMNVKLSLIGWFESASANGHRAYIEVRSLQKPLLCQ
jgi:hypothetical protein